MTAGRSLSAVLALLLCALPAAAQAPAGTVLGRVVDSVTEEPVSGATVSVAGRSVVTNDDGRYLLVGVPAGQHTLRVSLLGYRASVQAVTVVADERVVIDVLLVNEAIELAELVVIGYGERRQRDLTGVVQSVTTEEFNTGRIVSPEQLIQGKVAGLQVIDTGEPGGGISIRIRGGTSVNASNEPLVVIDGVPMPPGGGLSTGRNPFNFLNPDDVESVTVLKDAAAAAIYGANAANGVLIIQTKRGTVQSPRLTYTTSASASVVSSQANMLTPTQFREAVVVHAGSRTQYLGDATTDWRDAMLQTGVGQEHTLAMAGARENMNYRFSLGYLGQDGVVRGSAVERLSAALNFNQWLMDERLNLRVNLRGSRSDDDFTPGGGLGAATVFDPTQPIRTEAGYFEQEAFNLSPNNPLAELEHARMDGVTYRGIASLETHYRMPFLEELTGSLRLGYDVGRSERRTSFPSHLRGQQQQGERAGYWGHSQPEETAELLETYFTYARRFTAETDFDATAGYSYSRTVGEYPFYEEIGDPIVEEVSRRGARETKLASFFTRANYTLNDRYLFTGSVRREGSSRFGPANQWGTFPAAAFAWRISAEPFMPQIDWLAELKLRASWGVNGNQSIGDYRWAASYRPGDEFTQAQFGDEFIRTIRPSAVDPNIKWEETTSYNFGLDYGLFGNRATGSIEYYVKDTEDLLFEVPVAAGTYVSNFVLTNIGSVRNQGFEVSLSVPILDGSRGGLSWTASINAANNRNRLVAINPFAGGGEAILTGGIAGGVGSQIQVLQPGEPVNSFFVYRHKRDANGRPIYSNDPGLTAQENLLLMYEDVNGDSIINQNDRVPYKSPAPDWMFGHTSQFRYGRADLSFTVRANLGNFVYNNLASSQGYYNRLNEASGPINLHASVLENGFGTAQFFSDVYVEDASFLRMDNLTLGYVLPRLRGTQQVRLFGTVQNVFTLTGYSGVDPEAGLLGIDNNIYPRSRTFSIGANVNF